MTDEYADVKEEAKRRLGNDSISVSGAVRKYKIPRNIAINWQREARHENMPSGNVPCQIRRLLVPQSLADTLHNFKVKENLATREEAVVQILFEYFHGVDSDEWKIYQAIDKYNWR